MSETLQPPDELKNLTDLLKDYPDTFSHNIQLALTSSYAEISEEFNDIFHYDDPLRYSDSKFVDYIRQYFVEADVDTAMSRIRKDLIEHEVIGDREFGEIQRIREEISEKEEYVTIDEGYWALFERVLIVFATRPKGEENV